MVAPNGLARKGVTLIELMVVLSILVVLVSLSVLALQSARESARSISCQNKLHQLSLALTNFESKKRRLPGARMNIDDVIPGRPQFAVGPFAQLAEELEFMIQVEHGMSNLRSPQSGAPVILQCPSFPDRLGYRWNGGVDWNLAGNRLEENGILQRVPMTINKIVDGLSHTASFCERMSGTGFKDIKYSIVSTVLDFEPSEFEEVCEMAREAGSVRLDAGREWWSTDQRDWIYHHTRLPNSNVWDCDAFSPESHSVRSVLSARSRHPAKVHLALMDGAIQTISQTVDITVWRSLGNIADQR